MTSPPLTRTNASTATQARSGYDWLGIIAPLAGLVVLVVFFSFTSWYLVFKTLHVLAAIIWLGGGTVLAVLAWQARRTRSYADLLRIGKSAEWVGTRVFVPASLLVGGMGFVLMAKGDWSYGEFWPIFGITVWALSFLAGAAFLGPESAKLARLLEANGPDDPQVMRRLNRILAVARTDVVLILLVAAAMVAKPFL